MGNIENVELKSPVYSIKSSDFLNKYKKEEVSEQIIKPINQFTELNQQYTTKIYESDPLFSEKPTHFADPDDIAVYYKSKELTNDNNYLSNSSIDRYELQKTNKYNSIDSNFIAGNTYKPSHEPVKSIDFLTHRQWEPPELLKVYIYIYIL